MYCTECGRANARGAAFCGGCGAKLPAFLPMGNDSNVFGTEDRNIIEMVQDVLGRYMPVLYVSCAEGPTSTTIYALERLKEQGVADVSVFLDCSMVDDVELCDLVEIEIRECANEHGFNGDSITVQRGYAR